MSYSPQTWTDGSAGGTPISAARLTHIEDGLVGVDTRVGQLEDGEFAQRFDTYDIQGQTSPTVNTEVEGLTVRVDPQTTPFRVSFSIPWQMNTGTATAGQMQAIWVYLSDITSGTDVIYQQQQGSALAGAVTGKQWGGTLFHTRRFEPNTSARVFRMLARQASSTPTNWSQAVLLGQDAPVGGWTIGPMAIWWEKSP